MGCFWSDSTAGGDWGQDVATGSLSIRVRVFPWFKEAALLTDKAKEKLFEVDHSPPRWMLGRSLAKGSHF